MWVGRPCYGSVLAGAHFVRRGRGRTAGPEGPRGWALRAGSSHGRGAFGRVQ